MLLDRAAALGAERDLLEPRDLALALDARGVVGGQSPIERADAVADLKREMRRGRAHELADVLDGRLAAEPVGALELAHRRSAVYGAFACTGISSVSWSSCACWSTEIALSSPRIQARL